MELDSISKSNRQGGSGYLIVTVHNCIYEDLTNCIVWDCRLFLPC
ncbi:MAG: hypothetical protein BWX50_01149 [Euryarchaeota archaeon ADurb.Bin009]|nr:MAG: hypothetical protein BWX50_01149 [Euryarchaeota archaeon ADurb.Bin009]